MRYRLLMVLSMAAACSNDTVGPTPGAPPPAGDFAFAYSGQISGTFSATGEPDDSQTKPWAAAWRLEGTDFMVLAAILPRSATSHDAVAILVPRNTPGTSTISTICPPDGCADLFATFGRANGEGNDFLQGCHIVSGSVTIASIDAQRATGSFTGSGMCFSNTSGESAFIVSQGTFDLPIVENAPETPASYKRGR